MKILRNGDLPDGKLPIIYEMIEEVEASLEPLEGVKYL